MTYPNFYIVGAMKSGTTTLFDYLCQHDNIFMPVEKEPFYFIWGFLESAEQFQIPLGNKQVMDSSSWQVVATIGDYKALFDKVKKEQRVGEASTFYLPDPHVAQRIHAVVPDAKIVAVLRNPIERAYSSYTFQQSFGLEPAQSFREAIEDELAGNRDRWLYGWRHLYCGEYAEQVTRYIKTFGRDNVLLMRFEDLKRNPEDLCRQVFRFLEIDEHVALKPVGASNKTMIPPKGLIRSSKLLFSRPNIVKDTIKDLMPLSLRRNVKSRILAGIDRFGSAPEKMMLEDRLFLNNYFKKSILDLSDITGWDLSDWS